jgi:beta-glucanase (GH16 family)
MRENTGKTVFTGRIRPPEEKTFKIDGYPNACFDGFGISRPAMGGSISARISCIFLLTFAFFPTKNCRATVDAGDQEWKMVWSDEFTKDGPPDSSKWNFETGVARNNEPQCYTRNLTNVRIEKNHLILEAREETPPPGLDIRKWRAHDPAKTMFPVNFTSGSINTQGKECWLYGRFEIRAKLPKANCSWPAFWMMGINRQEVHWPECGEIDIMEYTGRITEGLTCLVSSDVHIAHFKNAHPSYTARFPVPFGNTSYHIYRMDWYPEHIDFFIDGFKYHTVEMSDLDKNGINPFRKPQFLLLNLAINRKKVTQDTLMPDQFVVDYVRVYQKPGCGL